MSKGLYCLMRLKAIDSEEVLMKVYYIYTVYILLNYATLLWGISKHYKNILNIHKEALRISGERTLQAITIHKLNIISLS